MDYREKLYAKYVSSFTSLLYGKPDLSKIKRQFPVWDKYYGKYLPKDKNIKILEIGCGEGAFLYYLKTLGYENCTGIDVSEEQIILAQKLGVKDIKKVDLREFLKDKKEAFDVVIARDIIEHFKREEIFDVVELIYKSLTKGGKFIIQTPNAESPFGGRKVYGDFTHEIAFTRSSLSQILLAIDFKNIKFHSTGPVVHGIKSTIRYFLWKVVEILLKVYLLVETGTSEGIFTQNLIAITEK